MQQFLIYLLVLLPLCGFLCSFFVPKNNETLIAHVAFYTVSTQLVLTSLLLIFWLISSNHSIDVTQALVILHDGNDTFTIGFIFDKASAVFLIVGGILSTMIILYSRAYLHREQYYKRFYNIILLFYSGYVLTIISGNLVTWFIGWEFLGISSFLLISFYRDRYLPVKNAYKVFCIYRLADIGIILSMWAFHSLLKSRGSFTLMNNPEYISYNLQHHYLAMLFISLMLLLSATAKSAQLPFSSWLSRAMEGPTSSSAIFYGSLSVHMGVFLLLRTFEFWQHLLIIRILVGTIGVATAIIASGIAKVQSSIKSQIAYLSIAQIGLMFLEIALGFSNLVLLHFAGNAFFRTYQLLVSPSIVNNAIRELSYSKKSYTLSFQWFLPKKLRYSLYIWYLKECNLELFVHNFLLMPMKIIGNKMHFIRLPYQICLFVLSILGGIFLLNNSIFRLNSVFNHYIALMFACFGIMALLKAFTFRRSAIGAWLLLIMNHCYMVLALSCNERFYLHELIIYLSGVFLAGLCGYCCLKLLKKYESDIYLNKFYGYSIYHPYLEIVFLLSCLGLMAFPISPTFIGEDLLFAHIGQGQFFMAFLVSVSFIFGGISTIRIYARLFMGQDIKTTADYASRYY